MAEPGSFEARAELEAGDTLLALELLVAEVGSAAWKKLRRGEITAEHAHDLLVALPGMLDVLEPMARLAPRALQIAASLDHPVYDCFYLALCESATARLVTDDRRLLERVRGTEWEARIDALRATSGEA